MPEIIFLLIPAAALLGGWCGYGLARDRHAHTLAQLESRHRGELARLAIRKFGEGASKAKYLDKLADLDSRGIRTHSGN